MLAMPAGWGLGDLLPRRAKMTAYRFRKREGCLGELGETGAEAHTKILSFCPGCCLRGYFPSGFDSSGGFSPFIS